jgi:ferredoxin
MVYKEDADKKTRAVIALLVETSRDCPGSGDCHSCLMQLTDGGCGSIRLRGILGELRFRRG